MANKNRLRELRTDTVINATAKQQESELVKALYKVVEYLRGRFAKRITLTHEK
jgi:sulfur relay (sulfurtransferase) DsrC/TusE family protein